MSTSTTSGRMGWSARLLIGLVLLIAGAAAMTWSLAHYPRMAQILGVAPASRAISGQRIAAAQQSAPTIRASTAAQPALDPRIGAIEARLARMENATQHAVGSAGRADALVVAFAARRAIDRGVALGYLEPLLVQRFGAQHQAAVATIITSARSPIRLSDLVAQYEDLGPTLRRGAPGESWWTGLSRELGSLVQVHRASRPSPDADARYQRALQHLSMGNVDSALAETMRMPGAGAARDWAAKARRYVAAQRALDEVESAALLGGNSP